MAERGGQPGNQNAAKAKVWGDAIKRAIARRAEGDMGRGLDTLADKLVAVAETGEQWALLEIGNRLDGKPAQIIIGDDDAAPVRCLIIKDG